MNKRLFLSLATLPLLGTAGQAEAAKPQDRPNIILFLVDDMGWQDTSVPFWEQETPFNRMFHTPNMKRLVKQGVKFTSACACMGSRGGVAAGRLSGRKRHIIMKYTKRLTWNASPARV